MSVLRSRNAGGTAGAETQTTSAYEFTQSPAAVPHRRAPYKDQDENQEYVTIARRNNLTFRVGMILSSFTH